MHEYFNASHLPNSECNISMSGSANASGCNRLCNVVKHHIDSSAAGVHAYSEKYKVAALGNIATHPDFRGNGFGKSVIAGLCRSLSENVDHIGLNVKADNAVAISLYEKLGFEIASSYYECNVTNNS